MYADVAQLICESAGNIQVNSTSKPSNNYHAARLPCDSHPVPCGTRPGLLSSR